jgi:hypothetical protein
MRPEWIMIRFSAAGGRAMRRLGNRLEAQVVGPFRPGESWERLGEVEWRAQQILCALDELGLHQPAAYVSMALDLMRQARLDLLPTG